MLGATAALGESPKVFGQTAPSELEGLLGLERAKGSKVEGKIL